MNTSVRTCRWQFVSRVSLIGILVSCIWAAKSSAQAPVQRSSSGQGEIGKKAELSPDSFYERLAQVSLKEERQLGSKLLPFFLERYNLTPDHLIRRGQRSEYIRDVSSGLPRLLKHAERYQRLDVAYLDTRQRILFGLPGGTLVASRERFTGTGTEDALFGLIAHEVSLMDRGCFLELLFDDTGKRRTIESLTDDDLRTWVAGQFPREVEELANRDVHGWMIQCIYEPGRYADYLDKVDRLRRTADETRGIDLKLWRVDHAVPSERAAALRAMSRQ